MAMSPKKPPPSVTNPAKKTPPKWNGPEDARKQKDAGKYPNYHEFKTRSGHTIIYDDSNGQESITLQHRTGSMMQMMPDGAVQMVTHNGQYQMVFGENRVVVTGANDITVHGAASLQVEGDFNTTIRGNHNTTVDGDMNVTAKNYNATVRGNMEMAAKSMSMKFEGNGMITSQGNMYLGGYGDVMIGSLGGSVGIGASGTVGIRSVTSEVAIQAQSDISIKSDGGEILNEAQGDISMKSSAAFTLQTSGKISFKAGGMIAGDGATIHWNSGNADAASSAKSAGDVTEAKKGVTPTEQSDDFSSGMGAPTKADYISGA